MDQALDTGNEHPEVSAPIERWLAQNDPDTPFVVMDLEGVRKQYHALRAQFPFAEIFYAVKANPTRDVIAAVAAFEIGFDLASDGEIERCLELGIAASRFSFGNTVKRPGDIERAFALGTALFVFDSEGELDKLARHAPGSSVFCRLAVTGTGAEWPLSRKFGCHPDMAVDLLCSARARGVKPIGVSFHVGSQQTEPLAWIPAIDAAAAVFQRCARAGLSLDFLNLGGGLPAHYRGPVPPLARYAEVIEAALRRNFGSSLPRTIIEPGRYLVGDAGLLRARVLLVARKSRHARHRWVYLDAGRYNGLPETLGERIHYALRAGPSQRPTAPVVLAGPTCDSTDVLYERAGCELPLDLNAGDVVDFLSAGAYTASYASVEFNGFAPIRTYCI